MKSPLGFIFIYPIGNANTPKPGGCEFFPWNIGDPEAPFPSYLTMSEGINRMKKLSF